MEDKLSLRGCNAASGQLDAQTRHGLCSRSPGNSPKVKSSLFTPQRASQAQISTLANPEVHSISCSASWIPCGRLSEHYSTETQN